jgi:hypothetical protein
MQWDHVANRDSALVISSNRSRVPVFVILIAFSDMI